MDGVSVIIPCYNSSAYLRSAIESALSQDYPGPVVEILVGDDGSTDESVALAMSFGPAVTVLRHPGNENRGVSATRNLCIREARHPFIALLDADDLWLPGHLSALGRALTARPEAMLAYDDGYYMDAEGRRYGARYVGVPSLDPDTMLVNFVLTCCGVLVRRQVFEEVGFFDESLRGCEDLDMWLRIVEQFSIVFVPVDGFLYRQHGQQATKVPEVLWNDGKRVVRRARDRYPYRRAAIRRKMGVLCYRLASTLFGSVISGGELPIWPRPRAGTLAEHWANWGADWSGEPGASATGGWQRPPVADAPGSPVPTGRRTEVMDGVSVIIPCYNGARYLRPCLDSVLAQADVGPLEVLVGDDGSHDGSADLAASYGPPVRLLHHDDGRNRGGPATRNLCLQAATKPLVAFLDQDDCWLPGHLAALAAALIAVPGAGLAYDNGYNMAADGRRLELRLAEPHRPRTTAADLLLDQCFPPAAVMVRRDVFAVVGSFDEELVCVDDQDMWVRILECFPGVYSPFRGYQYRYHAAQLSGRAELLWRQAERLLRKARRRYPYPPGVLRKRAAVIAYRQGQAALEAGRLLPGTYHLGRAAIRDPVRAVGEGVGRLLGRGTP